MTDVLMRKVVLQTDSLKFNRAGTDYLRMAWSAHVVGLLEKGKKYVFERPDKTTFDVIAVAIKNGETLVVAEDEIFATRYAHMADAEYALEERPSTKPAPVRSNILETKTERVVDFKPKPDDMYGKRSLPPKAVQALIVIGRCSERLQKENDNTLNTFNFHYTVDQAVKALESGTGYDTGEHSAYLPKVIRHLMVQVSRNLKDPLPVVKDFIQNERFMQLLDKAWTK